MNDTQKLQERLSAWVKYRDRSCLADDEDTPDLSVNYLADVVEVLAEILLGEGTK